MTAGSRGTSTALVRDEQKGRSIAAGAVRRAFLLRKE